MITPLGGSLGDISYQTYYADRLINTYAQIAASEQVMTRVKSILDLEKLPEIKVKTVPNSEIINITVTDQDPDLAAKIANTLAQTTIAKSQENVGNGDSNSQDLNILTTRQVALQKELEQAKLDREKQVVLYAQTTAQMNTLDRTIQMKEAEYQNLLDRYQRAVIDEAVARVLTTQVAAETTKNIMSTEIDTLEADLSRMRKQYQDLSTSSAIYNQQIISTGQTVQNKENAHQALLAQIDSVRIADSKYESAQEVMIASLAVAPLEPTGPGKILTIGLGFLCGLILGVLLAFLWNTLDFPCPHRGTGSTPDRPTNSG